MERIQRLLNIADRQQHVFFSRCVELKFVHNLKVNSLEGRREPRTSPRPASSANTCSIFFMGTTVHSVTECSAEECSYFSKLFEISYLNLLWSIDRIISLKRGAEAHSGCRVFEISGGTQWLVETRKVAQWLQRSLETRIGAQWLKRSLETRIGAQWLQRSLETRKGAQWLQRSLETRIGAQGLQRSLETRIGAQ
jgi:hypothetical protein